MPDVAAAVARACGAGVVSVRPVAGGDICRAWRVTLVDGTPAFAKTFAGEPAMFDAEARSLRWLADAGAPVPRVLGVGTDVLVLEWLDAARPSRAAARRLAAALATVHAAGADRFGAPWPGFAGRLQLSNMPASTWAEFFAATRLLPLARQAHDSGALDDLTAIERVAVRLPSVGGPAEPPARLHGTCGPETYCGVRMLRGSSIPPHTAGTARRTWRCSTCSARPIWTTCSRRIRR